MAFANVDMSNVQDSHKLEIHIDAGAYVDVITSQDKQQVVLNDLKTEDILAIYEACRRFLVTF